MHAPLEPTAVGNLHATAHAARLDRETSSGYAAALRQIEALDPLSKDFGQQVGLIVRNALHGVRS